MNRFPPFWEVVLRREDFFLAAESLRRWIAQNWAKNLRNMRTVLTNVPGRLHLRVVRMPRSLFLFFLYKTIITRSLSRKSRQGVETGQKSSRNETVFEFCLLLYDLSSGIFSPLTGLSRGQFQPENLQKNKLSRKERLYAQNVTKKKEGAVIVPKQRRTRRM